MVVYGSQPIQRSIFRLFQTVDGFVVPTQIDKISKKTKGSQIEKNIFFMIKVTPISTIKEDVSKEDKNLKTLKL